MEIRLMYGPDISQRFIDVLSTLSDVGLSVEEAREVFRYRFRNNVKTAIAIEDGQIVGTASLTLEKKFLHKGAMAGHIEDVAVHPDFQKKGIGKALVEFLLKLAGDFDCYKVTLHCYDDLVVFYEKCGMRRVGSQLRFDVSK